jgi:hypothetical protein
MKAIARNPAAVLILCFSLAWAVSCVVGSRFFLPVLGRWIWLDVSRGYVAVTVKEGPGYWGVTYDLYPPEIMDAGFMGTYWVDAKWPTYACIIPLAWLITLMVPFAVGSAISYRFRIWHYLAFTLLVAVELAYYVYWAR